MINPECSSKSLLYLQVTLFCSTLVGATPTWFNTTDKANLNDTRKLSSIITSPTNANLTSKYGQNHRRPFNKSVHMRWRRITTYQYLDDVELPSDGEIGMLWLPYVIFTVVLLSLIFLSFMKFHCQRGDQYRRRREEMEDKPILNEIKDSQKEKNGICANDLKQGFELSKYSTIAKTVPDHLSLFLKFSQLDENHSGVVQGSWFNRRHSSDDPVLVQDKNHTSHLSAPYKKSLLSGAPTTFSEAKNHTVAYTFNANGSMVDVRCSNDERSNTFQVDRDVTTQTLLTRNGLESTFVSSSSAGSRKIESAKKSFEKRRTDIDSKANSFSINSTERKSKNLDKKITIVKMVDVATSPALFFKSRANGSNVYCVQIP